MAGKVTALIPAHNEEGTIAEAVAALLQQSTAPHRLVVVSDNSTDRTVSIARGFGNAVEVMETEGNGDRKAGALNQALARLDIEPNDYVLVVDADTRLAPAWIETALKALEQPGVGAVGGVFLGDGENGVLGHMQGLEYARYRRQIRRDNGRARVLTGTSTMVRKSTLDAVEQARAEGTLPGEGVYNVKALTEDFELTIAIRRLGFETTSPDGCTVVTETMPTIGMLWKQRVRWQRGALDVLIAHGLSRVTAPYIARQIEAGAGVAANGLLWGITIWAIASGAFALVPFWLAVGGLFYAERVVSGKEYGARGTVMAATVATDMLFDAIISAVWIWSLWLTVSNGERGWGLASIDSKGAGTCTVQ